MTTLSAGASASFTLTAGNQISGVGAGTAVIGRAGTVQALTAGDAWRIGPYLTAQTVSITSTSAMVYEQVAQVSADPSPADLGLTAAVVAALPALVSDAGIFSGSSRICGVVGASVEAATLRTSMLKVEAEAPFDAVRITICTRHTSAAANWKGVVAPTSTAARTNANTLFRPTLDGSAFSTGLAVAGTPFGWRALSFAGAATGTVPAAASALLPAYLQSDWIACQSVARVDGGTRPLAMIRLFHDGTADGSHSIIQGLQPSGGYADQTAKSWYREWQVGASVSVDMVANLATEPGSLAGSAFWIEVEFAYRGVAAKTVLGIGDSIMESNATQLPGNVYGAYGFRGCALASTPSAPVHWINAGMSSQNSATYFAQGRAALAQFAPTHVLYSAYSPNDATQPVQFETDAMRQRVLQMLELCRAQKARMLLVTAVPNENHTLATDNARKAFNTWVRELCATGAARLVDYAAAVGNGASPELFGAGLKFDAVHPSDTAMDLGAELVRSAILAA